MARNSRIEAILRQTAEAEGFRYIVERRHLLEAADEIEYLRGQIAEMEDQVARAIDDAKYEAAIEAEREMRREFRDG